MLNKTLIESETHIDKAAFFLFLIIAIYLMVVHLSPTIGSNEAVYVLQVMKWANPGLYTNDWSLNLSNSFGVYFSAFSYPFFSLIEDKILAVQLLRVILWGFLIFSIVNLTSAMKIDLRASLFGILIFLGIQNNIGLMAGEWLFGGAEQKVISYGLSFLALSAMLKQKYALSGLFSGLAFFTHVIVGGWSAIGLSIIVLAQGRKEFFRYAYSAVPLALVTFLIVFSGMKHEDIILFADLDVAESLVTFRNPHHLNASVFTTTDAAIIMFGCLVLISYNCWFVNSNKEIKYISYYLLIMGTFVAAGFVAHKFKYFDLLALYPYRVAAVTWPLISAIYFSNLLLHSWRKRQVILSKKLLLSFFLSVIVILIPLTYAFYGWISDTPKLLEGTKGNAQKIDDNKTYAWIKNHTPIDSVVLANPCRGDFWFSAERAMVVNFKLTPVNINYHEWYRRMFTLNRSKDFAGNGFGACADLDQNFNALSEEQLKNIQLLYRTDYYLSDIERLDLYRCLVFRGEVNFIYDLAVCDIRAKIE